MVSKTRKGFAYIDLMEKKPKRYLGDYTATSGPIAARLTVSTQLEPHIGSDRNSAWVSIRYDVQAFFENKGSDNSELKAKIAFEYNDKTNLREIIGDLSAREEDLEGIFQNMILHKSKNWSPLKEKPEWKFRRNIIRCILELEEKIEEIDAAAEIFRKEYDD
jgi:hypothetical protein